MSLLRSHREAEQAKRLKAAWYSLNPKSLVVITAYIGLLIFLPVIRGEFLTETAILAIALHLAKVLLAALLVAWVIWRLSKRSDKAANNVICVLIIAVGLWTLGLSAPQRAAASEIVNEAISKPVSAVTEMFSGDGD